MWVLGCVRCVENNVSVTMLKVGHMHGFIQGVIV